MTQDPYTVTVAKDLEDLVPTFLANRARELQALRAALAAGDMAQLRHLGHRMKGVGNSYGFAKVSEIGRRIEDGAQTRDAPALEACVREYADYLAKVKVLYA